MTSSALERKGCSASSGPMDAFGPGGGPVSQPTKPQAPKVSSRTISKKNFILKEGGEKMKIGTKKQPESVILQAVRNALVIDGYDVTRHQQGLGSRR